MPLNPNAKEFSFNPGANEFVPGGGFSFAFTTTAAPFVPASEPKSLSKDAQPFVPGSNNVFPGSDSAHDDGDTAKQDLQDADAQLPDTSKEGSNSSAASASNSSAPSAVAEGSSSTLSAPVSSGRSWASLAARKPDNEPSKVVSVAPSGNGNGVPEKSPKIAPVKSTVFNAAPSPQIVASGAPLSQPKPLNATPPGPSPSGAAKPEKSAPKLGSRFALKVLLDLRENATPIDVLKTQLEDLRKCMEDESDASGIFDLNKDAPSKAGVPGNEGGADKGGGGGRGMRRTNSDMRGRNRKNQEPLRDKQGMVIEVKALEVSENRWKPSKATDEEEKLFKTVKGLLNKLTLEKFDTLYQQIRDVGINTASLLRGFVVLLYDKAVMEPTFIGMYAKMCQKLATELPECSDEHGVLPFAEVLVGKCRSEFDQMGDKEGIKTMADLPSDEREQKLRKLRQRTLGNVEFIGELFQRNMVGVEEVGLSIGKLMEDVEADSDKIQPLCKLLEGVGKSLEGQSKVVLEECFKKLEAMQTSPDLSARYKFMLMDLADLRRNGWVPRRAASGPKTLEDVQKEVDKENRYTEKKKEKVPAKKEGKGKDKKDGGKKERKGKKEAAVKAEDEGWSQVTVDKQKGKQGGKKGGHKAAKEEPAVSTPIAASPKGGKTPAKGIPAVRGGFAALMGDDDDKDDDDDDDDDDEEAEDKEEDEEDEDEEEGEVEGDDEAPAEEELSEDAAGKVGSILEEFMCIHDVEEASQCLQELHEKGFPRGLLNEEIVHRGLLLALDASEKECELMGRMFRALLADGLMSGLDGARGFCKVLRDLPDVAIDIPKAPALLAGVVRELQHEATLLDAPALAQGLAALRQACPQSAKPFEGLA